MVAVEVLLIIRGACGGGRGGGISCASRFADHGGPEFVWICGARCAELMAGKEGR